MAVVLKTDRAICRIRDSFVTSHFPAESRRHYAVDRYWYLSQERFKIRGAHLSLSRTVSIVILLALSLGRDTAKAQDQSGQHRVSPLSTFQPGQWVEKVSGDFT